MNKALPKIKETEIEALSSLTSFEYLMTAWLSAIA
jgi:hypothetical protein